MNISIQLGQAQNMQIKPVITVNEPCHTVEAPIQPSIHLQQSDEVMQICFLEFLQRTKHGNILLTELLIHSLNLVLGHVNLVIFQVMFKHHNLREDH